MSRPLVVFVDVDDTLVRHVGRRHIVIPGVVATVRRLASQGVQLYCWSRGGAEHAAEVAHEVGLSGCFLAFLPKPNINLDDASVADWGDFVEMHPAQARDCTRESLERLLGWEPS